MSILLILSEISAKSFLTSQKNLAASRLRGLKCQITSFAIGSKERLSGRHRRFVAAFVAVMPGLA